MKVKLWIVAGSVAMLLLVGCSSLDRYRLADENKHRIESLAVLPLVVGDDDGRVRTIGGTEYLQFVEYFDSRFHSDFESTVQLSGSVDLLLPGRDFDIVVHNGMDLQAIARDLGVDAVLSINLVLYNEIKPGAKGAQVAAAVLTTLFLGGYVVENAIVEYETHFAYLDIERVDEYLSFEYAGEAFPSIEAQREQFVDRLLAYLDLRFPLSTDYEPLYESGTNGAPGDGRSDLIRARELFRPLRNDLRV